MDLSLRTLRFRLLATGVLPRTRLARAACYLLGLDLLLFALQRLFGIFKVSYGNALSGWGGILSALAIVLLAILAYRWLKARLLWRLRNRLIVTYVFIGVIPVVLLVAMAFITIYLFAGQFANFVVTSDLTSRLRSLEAVNAAIANELAARVERGQPATAESLEGLKRHDPAWVRRKICAWNDEKPLSLCGEAAPGVTPFARAPLADPQFGAVVSDGGKLYLRSATTLHLGSQKLTVVSSEPLDRNILDVIAADLGEITLFAAAAPPAIGVATPPAAAKSSGPLVAIDDHKGQGDVSVFTGPGGVVLESGQEELHPVLTS